MADSRSHPAHAGSGQAHSEGSQMALIKGAGATGEGRAAMLSGKLSKGAERMG